MRRVIHRGRQQVRVVLHRVRLLHRRARRGRRHSRAALLRLEPVALRHLGLEARHDAVLLRERGAQPGHLLHHVLGARAVDAAQLAGRVRELLRHAVALPQCRLALQRPLATRLRKPILDRFFECCVALGRCDLHGRLHVLHLVLPLAVRTIQAPPERRGHRRDAHGGVQVRLRRVVRLHVVRREVVEEAVHLQLHRLGAVRFAGQRRVTGHRSRAAEHAVNVDVIPRRSKCAPAQRAHHSLRVVGLDTEAAEDVLVANKGHAATPAGGEEHRHRKAPHPNQR
mmetsp:Transcript_55622/g.132067  ORF Transcript_55622/g.132067 Transcript_55622/m.132067 type:complete len:283 (+) Transcript_55622:649-1497(+)